MRWEAPQSTQLPTPLLHINTVSAVVTALVVATFLFLHRFLDKPWSRGHNKRLPPSPLRGNNMRDPLVNAGYHIYARGHPSKHDDE